MRIVNLERYPIHKKGNPEHRRLLQLSSIKQLQQRGFVSLPNFLRTDAINELTASILELERRGVGFHSNDTHNVFLEEDADKSTASPLPSSMHPRHIQLESSKLILNASDLAPYAAGLENLFTSEDFHRFIGTVLNTQLHPSTDPYGKYYANVFREGDGLNWHFDRSEYSISLILQPADEGGEFQFVPRSRDVVKGWDEMPLSVEDVSRALRPHSKVVESPKLAAGDVYIFQGHNALHRVSKIAKGTRINIILTFGTEEAGTRLNAYTLQKFFGIIKDSPES